MPGDFEHKSNNRQTCEYSVPQHSECSPKFVTYHYLVTINNNGLKVIKCRQLDQIGTTCYKNHVVYQLDHICPVEKEIKITEHIKRPTHFFIYCTILSINKLLVL